MRKGLIVEALLVIVGLFVLAVFSWKMWNLQREWNYRLGYKSMVQDTVREMVKKEALK